MKSHDAKLLAALWFGGFPRHSRCASQHEEFSHTYASNVSVVT